MKKLALAVALAVAGSALAQVRVDVRLPSIFFPAPPPMVAIEPGIQVVQDYDEEVFYVDNYYWHRRGDLWYRTNTHNGNWVLMEPRFVPPRLTFYEPGRFRQWRGSDDQRRSWNEWRERNENRREDHERMERDRYAREQYERGRVERDNHERERMERENHERREEHRDDRWDDRRDNRRDERGEQRGGYVVPPQRNAPPPSGYVHGSAPAGDTRGSAPAGPAAPPPRKRPQPVVH